MSRAGRSRRVRRAADGLRQLPWQTVTNPHPRLELLDDDALQRLHDASLVILGDLGIEVWNRDARQLFADAGASVDGDVVRFGSDLVEHALGSAPSSFSLTSRNPARSLVVGGDRMVFGLVAGPPSVHDRVRGRRASNRSDYADFIRLAQVFNAIHLIGNQVAAPLELPANSRHLDAYLMNLTLSDLCFHCTAIGRGRAVDGIELMARSRGIGLDEMAASPGVITVININSPRRLDGEMADGLMAMAEHGQPVTITPFTLMGAMTPATLAAALAQQNAEALFGVVLTQLVRPGAPVAYGSFTSNVDMRTGSPAFGTPEHAKANIISGQLARRYGLPYRASNASASNTVDAQAAYETQMSLWGCVMGGANLVYHAAGWMEGGLQASFEKLVLDVEMLQQMIEFCQPVTVDDDSLGLDAMRRVGPGGHFFGDPHTLDRYESAFYEPLLSDWRNHETWAEDGARSAAERATVVWQQALSEYEQPPVADDALASMVDYVERRRSEIGTGEP